MASDSGPMTRPTAAKAREASIRIVSGSTPSIYDIDNPLLLLVLQVTGRIDNYEAGCARLSATFNSRSDVVVVQELMLANTTSKITGWHSVP